MCVRGGGGGGSPAPLCIIHAGASWSLVHGFPSHRGGGGAQATEGSIVPPRVTCRSLPVPPCPGPGPPLRGRPGRAAPPTPPARAGTEIVTYAWVQWMKHHNPEDLVMDSYTPDSVLLAGQRAAFDRVNA